ncbi:MAG TPA: alkaline phosphatase family protein [Rhizomicrobium sp.]|nr:alkaline phosphatase family protein [Rhizomicrobium sp.]
MKNIRERIATAAFAAVFLAAAAANAHAQTGQKPQVLAMPHYAHIFVIIEENHTTDEIVPNPAAPNLTRFAQNYGYAWRFYAERHPSEPNYVAILGGDTFGISDDDAFWCKPGVKDPACSSAAAPGYVDHTVDAPSLAAQLAAHHLTWKGYFEDIPTPGSRAYRWPDAAHPVAGKPAGLYAVKHNGFMNFKDVQDDPALAQKIAGFDAFERDVASGNLPNYAQIVPNQCDDMHGLPAGANVPADCVYDAGTKLISRGDAVAGRIVGEIMRSALWSRPDNSAIVITFDESDVEHPDDNHAQGCCGSVPGDRDNPGGGWIPTIVITNHGPRALTDLNPCNHYSLLRTTEDAFGMDQYLRHAGDTAHGVQDMTSLFYVRPAQWGTIRSN